MKNKRSNGFLALLASSVLLSASSVHAQSWSGTTSGDWLTTTVNLVFNGASSLVDWSDSFWQNDQSWLVYDVNGAITNLNNLTINSVDWLDGDDNPFLSERPDGLFSFSEGVGGVYLNYAVVPETSTGLLGALGALALLRRRRK